MTGQGSPRASCQRRLARAWAATGHGCPIALAVLASWLLCACATAGELNLRLRIAWGGGTERLWSGAVALSEGTLAEPLPLGIEADEAGSMSIQPGPPPSLPVHDKPKSPPVSGAAGYLLLRQRSPRTYDGVDLLVTAPADALLLVALDAPNDSKQPEWTAIRLADVLRTGFAADLDDRGNRLVVHRSPGDDLHVRLPRPSLVFSSNETFKCDVFPHLPAVEPGTKVRLRLQLMAGRTGQELWSDERAATAGDAAPVPVEIPLGKWGEGVYDLVVSAMHAGKFHWPTQVRPQLGFRSPLAERSVQFVVLDPKPPAVSSEGKLAAVVEIDPANPKWWDRVGRLPQWSRWPRLGKGPLGNGNARTVEHPLGDAAQLAPNHNGEVSWEAYPLPIVRPGEPHVLEIDYPSDVPQTLGISIIEPNAAGAVVPIGLDSGIDRAEQIQPAAGAPHWLQHRVVFWPRTKAPVLLMTNRRDREPAVYGKIRVLAGWGRLPPAFPGAAPPERLLAGYLDRPLFPENFSASESLGSLSDLSVDDWITFYEGGTRLVEYLHHVGYNGLMLSVAADGSAIYPSAALQPTPRYDTGVFFATGQDPVRKDVLEMLLRLFDREGLQLVPALEFGAPLPEIEALLRRGGPEAEGLVWIGPEGESWTQVYSPLRGKAPYYNTLHPRVQEAMLAVVREVAGGYARHPALSGLALQLSAYSYAQLPGPEWGLDDATIARFERDKRIQLPADEGARRYARRLQALGPIGSDGRREWRPEWIEWRAAQMSRFYRRVFDELSAARPGGRLYLAGGEMFTGPEWEREFRPTLPRKTTVAEALLLAGIDSRYFGEDRGIVLLRPERVAPQGSLARQAMNLELRQAPDLDRYFQPLWPGGALFFHQPQELRLASFDEKGPFRPCYTWLAAQPVPSGEQNRRRFIHSLATLDPQAMFDGGWMLPLGQEDALRDLVAVYRQLPAVRFERVPEGTSQAGGQTVTARYATRADRTYAYLVNDAPFSATARLRVDLPAGCRMEPLAGSRPVGPLRRDSEGAYWEAELGPYDLLAARFSAPGVRFSNPQAAYPPDVQAALEKKLGDLGDRVAALAYPPVLDVLSNPDFDRPASRPGLVPGWTVVAPPGVTVELDPTTKHSGAQSLRLASTGPAGGLASPSFLAPATGRLSLSVWLRVADVQQQPPLRLTLAGKAAGSDFFRSAPVGQAPGATVPPIGVQWSQFVVHMNDLPLEDLSDLSLRFELIGPGEVWIDDVQLCHLAFSDKERKALVRLLTPADVMLQNGQVANCLHLLDGYWPRFLVSNVPVTALPVSRKPDTAASDPPKESPRSSGLFEKMKGLVPERRR